MDLGERVETLQQEALAAEAQVARLRTLLSSRTTDKTVEETNAAAASFDSVYADAQVKRSRADAQGRLSLSIKKWIEALPGNTKLIIQHVSLDGHDLARVRVELAKLRDELRTLQGNPPASSDIGKRIDDLVADWAHAARPMVRGFAAGQAFDVRWPMAPDANRQNGNGFNIGEGNGLLLFAAMFPAELSELIFRAIHAAQPLSVLEHGERVNAVTTRIHELSYIEAALVERHGGDHSVDASPWCILGVRLPADEGDAAVEVRDDVALRHESAPSA